MKIKHKFLIIFVVLLLVSLSVSSYIAFKTTEASVVSTATKTMEHDLNVLSSSVGAFHKKAGDTLVFALNYPPFVEYFSLKETLAGNKRDKNGVITLTPAQRALKSKIDRWAMHIQSRFPVAETCLIDATGQEHSRITFGEVAPDDDFSDSEHHAAFFLPTFKLNKGEFHVQYPYMSADAKQWVFAYTSPVVLSDGNKPAIYHFEIPISYFQELVSKTNSVGRTFVLDPSGLIVADSKANIPIKLKAGADIEDEHKLSDYLPQASSISKSPEFQKVVEQMSSVSEGTATFEDDGVEYYVSYKKLPTFGWTVAEVKSYDELMDGASSLASIKRQIFLTVVVTLGISVVVIVVVSGRMTRPLLALTEAAKEIASGDLHVDLPEIDTKDEIAHLNGAMRNMVERLKAIIDEVEGAAAKVDSACHELTDGSGKLAEGICGQSDRAQQIAAASEEMTSTISELAKNASNIADTARTTSDLAVSGEAIVERSVNEVKAIAGRFSGLASSVKGLGEHSQQISEIVDVIKEIAEQTNLLALNAAIEAARAGEQGRGFSVVADEVRNLSERTSKSTAAINDMIKAIQREVDTVIGSIGYETEKVNEGVNQSLKAGVALRDIVESVKNLQGMVDQIASATDQMSTTSELISKDISIIASVSKDSSNCTESISGSLKSLSALSGGLQDSMKKLKT